MPALDIKFETLVAKVMTARAGAVAAGLINQGQRPAIDYSSDEISSPDPNDLNAVKDFFNTVEAWVQYHAAVAGTDSESNKLAVKMAAKLQSDLVSQLERDFKSASLTPVRARLFEASRRAKHSERGGPIYSNLIQMVQALSSFEAKS